MARPHRSWLAGWALCGALAGAPAGAVPIVPAGDDQVIEVLPATAGRRDERRLRRQLAAQPRDSTLALALAQRSLAQAHASGDPRFAGQALAALAGWRDPAETPDAVLLVRADLQQYLHEFDAAAASLQALLARPRSAQSAHAWLMLATIRRVQGRYADSDAACQGVARGGAALHARACLAENAGLRGEVARARAEFAQLLASPAQAPATQAWLQASVAELEQRAGHAAAAEAAFKTALALAPDAYTALAYADFLIEQRRPEEVLPLLRDQPRSDAVLLRLAIAGARAGAPGAAADAQELRERIALANQRPDAPLFHGREQALFALAIDRAPQRALVLARGNAERQREALDLLVLAQAARASGDARALQETRRLVAAVGLVDRRIEALW